MKFLRNIQVTAKPTYVIKELSSQLLACGVDFMLVSQINSQCGFR